MIVCIDTKRPARHVRTRRSVDAAAPRIAGAALHLGALHGILLEYEEIVAREMGVGAVERLMQFIEFVEQARGVICRVSPSFRFHLITGDADDNKFADCAIAAEADFIIIDDQHFQVMLGSGYKPQPVMPEEFIRLHLSGG